MISVGLGISVVLGSLLISAAAYIYLGKREGTYLNVLTPSFFNAVAAYYLLQLVYISALGTGYSTFAYVYVYSSLAVESWAFVLAYTYRPRKVAPRAGRAGTYTGRNFTVLSLACLVLACVIYAPVLVQFRDYLLNPREIYKLTRTGFGHETFVSSTLGYLAVIFILFAKRSWLTKSFVIVAASGLILLHGSKGQVLNLVFLILLFQVYVRQRRIALLPALVRSLAIAGVVIALFAVTISLGDGPVEAVQAISQYSDYTRNAMLTIDSHFPPQYGRFTMEANFYGRVPRVLMPNKPKNFGSFHLAEEFYPEWFDSDTGSPDFGIGVQYADFGALAIVYLALFAILKGCLARVFVNRLRLTQHPADFFVVAFLAEISVIPLGGGGWLFPEALVAAMLMRFFSRIGPGEAYRERIRSRRVVTDPSSTSDSGAPGFSSIA
jgi:hypothetical protein